MKSQTYAVRSIAVAGELVFGLEGASLQVIEPPDLPDFVLSFETPSAPRPLPPQADLEVVVEDGRTFRANGIDILPNPWRHRYTNGLGVPGWA